MDRYQMAIRKHTIRPIAYKFKPSASVSKICKYMKKCIEDKVIFDSDGMNPASMDSAIVKIGKELNVPILVDSDRTAKIMSISHSYKNIYSLEKSPQFPFLKYPYALYYTAIIPSQDVTSPKALLVIQK